jgi:hypothetical protein
VESAPPPAASSAQVVTQPTPLPSDADAADDDPFNVFEDDNFPAIVPAGAAARDRVRALQDNGDEGANGSSSAPSIVVPTIAVSEIVVPTVSVEPSRDGTIEVVMPDVDAMIEEITARATDPNRNPNVDNPGGRDRGQENARDDADSERSDANARKKKSAKERNDERRGRRTPTPSSRAGADQSVNVPVIQPSSGPAQEDCRNPFANLPEDRRPKDFPFDC